MVYLASLCYTWDTFPFPISHLIPSKHVLLILQFCTLDAVDEKSQKNLRQYFWPSWNTSLLPILSTSLFRTTDLCLSRARYEPRGKIRLSPAQSKYTARCDTRAARHPRGSHSFKAMPPAAQRRCCGATCNGQHKENLPGPAAHKPAPGNRSDSVSYGSSQSPGKRADRQHQSAASTRASGISQVPHVTDYILELCSSKLPVGDAPHLPTSLLSSPVTYF